MSQEKVNKYKERKANRKEILQKEKRNRKLEKAAWIIVFALIIAGIAAAIGIEIHNWYENTYLPSRPDYTTESLIISDVAGVLEEETEAAEEPETEAEAEEETEAEAAEDEETGLDNEVAME